MKFKSGKNVNKSVVDMICFNIISKLISLTSINRYPNDRFWTLPNGKSLQTTISKLIKMAERSTNV